MFLQPAANHIISLAPSVRTSLRRILRVPFKSAAKFLSTYLSPVFLALTQSDEDRERARRDAYLAEAIDIYDLEWRMREMDRRDRHTRQPMLTGMR